MSACSKQVTQALNQLLIDEKFYEAANRKYWASEVTFSGKGERRFNEELGIETVHQEQFDIGRGKQSSFVRADFVSFVPQNQYELNKLKRGKFFFWEVKSCSDDFHSGRHHTFFGNYGYYVMTSETYHVPSVYEAIEQTPYGVYVPSRNKERFLSGEPGCRLICARKAKHTTAERDPFEILFRMTVANGRDRNKALFNEIGTPGDRLLQYYEEKR